jgi:nitrate reductase gamma subunit
MAYYILTYICIAVFIVAVVRLIYKQWTLPLHVRWEIYPVQHETAERAVYGGSYMEEADWWQKKQDRSLLNELRYMVPEILLMRGLWKENRSLWRDSFPFHLGLYLMTATFALLLIHAGFTLWGFSAFTAGGAVRTLLDGLIALTGWLGMIAGLLGGLGLLYRRLSDPALRAYAAPADYLNICAILLFFFVALMAAFAGDPALDGAKAYVLGLLTAGTSASAYTPGRTLPGALTIILASLMAAYIPLTHMSHMFMKYFLYHSVKWDDAPNRPGSPIESAVLRNLQLKPTWQATHVGANGQKSWQDIAAPAPKEVQ